MGDRLGLTNGVVFDISKMNGSALTVGSTCRSGPAGGFSRGTVDTVL
jgi:hypothetical protein